jgi:hypothetical protein
MFLRGDIVTHTLTGAIGTVTGVTHGHTIVAWRFGNTSMHATKELRRP